MSNPLLYQMPSQPNLGGRENTGCNRAAPGKARAPEFPPRQVIYRGAVSPELRPTSRHFLHQHGALSPRPPARTPDSHSKGPDGAEKCRVRMPPRLSSRGAQLNGATWSRNSSCAWTALCIVQETPDAFPPEFLPA